MKHHQSKVERRIGFTIADQHSENVYSKVENNSAHPGFQKQYNYKSGVEAAMD